MIVFVLVVSPVSEPRLSYCVLCYSGYLLYIDNYIHICSIRSMTADIVVARDVAEHATTILYLIWVV